MIKNIFRHLNQLPTDLAHFTFISLHGQKPSTVVFFYSLKIKRWLAISLFFLIYKDYFKNI